MLTRFSTCLLALIACISQPVLATGEPAATDIVFQETLSQTMASGQSWRYSNGDVYQGEWRNNRPHGQGRYQRMNGDDYTGLFHNGRFQGEGVCKFGNGDTYKGNWENGQPSGQGEMRYQNGNRYVGEWKEGKRHGKGQLFYRSGSYYKGNWAENEKSGKGFMQYRNGERYVGDYAGNNPHGFGVQVESTGDVYRGTFSRGARHGAGECNREGGEVRVCLFDRGNEIRDPVKLDLARQYLEKKRPVYEFNGGIAYQMEDEFTKARYHVSSERVWWEKTEAMLKDQLRIRSEDENQFIYLIVNGYTGPGTYHLHKGEIIASSRDGEPVELSDDAVARVDIKSDRNGQIDGSFSISGLKGDGDNPRRYRLYDGQFQASATPPDDATPSSEAEKLLVKNQQERD
ncbi:MAG: MORN repeat-containing protein [Pseudomonadota bacterium]